MAAVHGDPLRHLTHVTRDTFVFRSRHVIFWRAPESDSRAQAADGKADAAETASEIAIEVEETQMQSRRNRYNYAVCPVRHRGGGPPGDHSLLCFIQLSLCGLSQNEYRLTMCHPDWVGNLDTQTDTRHI
jgi:hypothetical protein